MVRHFDSRNHQPECILSARFIQRTRGSGRRPDPHDRSERFFVDETTFSADMRKAHRASSPARGFARSKTAVGASASRAPFQDSTISIRSGERRSFG